MAERNPVSWLNAGAHTAENDRITEAWATEGVESGAALAVTAPGGMFVRVAAGRFGVTGTNTGTQGMYKGYNDASVDKSINAAHATLSRLDIVVAQVIDAAYIGGGTNQWQLAVIAGTPGSGSEPAMPNNALKLATVTVPAAAGAINSGNIADKRKMASAVGGVAVVLSSDTPTTRPGARRFDTDLNRTQERNAADTAWLPKGNFYVAALASAPSPTFTGAVLLDPNTKIWYYYNGSAWVFPPWWQKIDEKILVADGAVSFTSIPALGTDLRVEGVLRGNFATTQMDIWARINADATANYDYMGFFATTVGQGETGPFAQNQWMLGRAPGNNLSANIFGEITIDFPNYASTTMKKLFKTINGYNDGANNVQEHWWTNGGHRTVVGAITQIDLTCGVAGAGYSATGWKAGTRLALLARGS